MQNRDLRTLREIARLGSFQGAAERLHMTLSAVSMQMKALEASLNASLFDRSVRPPRLTALGRRVAEAAKDVLVAEDALRALTGPDVPLTGRFRLGIVASAGARLLPSFLANAPASLPHARFDVRTGLSEALETAVASGALDAAVVTATGVPMGGTRHVRISRDRLMLAVPKGADDRPPFLQFAPGTGIGRLIAAESSHHARLSDAPRIVLDHVDTILACLDAGLGATILPEVDLGRARKSCDLIPLQVWRDLVLVTRSESPLDAEAETLARLLLA
ncbi:LysR family transcriptional regulator [Jannaschia sp. 2305UL9-9]|uniref:LysR family transcriptional regulator n=1 Tax=Jannaschia sp. 2305UL9-9 TaxID=3121638 RepID=UPI0035277158